MTRMLLEEERAAAGNTGASLYKKRMRDAAWDATTPHANESIRKRPSTATGKRKVAKSVLAAAAAAEAAAAISRDKKSPTARARERVSAPVVVELGPSCAQCGGDRGALLTCTHCHSCFHARCVDAEARPSKTGARWVCASCTQRKARDRTQAKKRSHKKKPK